MDPTNFRSVSCISSTLLKSCLSWTSRTVKCKYYPIHTWNYAQNVGLPWTSHTTKLNIISSILGITAKTLAFLEPAAPLCASTNNNGHQKIGLMQLHNLTCTIHISFHHLTLSYLHCFISKESSHVKL